MQGQASCFREKSPALRVVFFPKNLAFPNPYLFKHPKRKRPMRQKDALKKMSDKREADKIVWNSTPSALESALKQKNQNSEDMTATADFRQMAQYIGLAICGLMVRTAFGVFGILWGIIREIVNGVFRVTIGVIMAILSTIVFFGFILWLFTL